MKKLTLALVALSLTVSPAFAMSSTENIPASNQPVDPADMTIFAKDNNGYMDCHFKAGSFSRLVADTDYNTLLRHYNAAAQAARPDKNNRAKFLEYREKYGAVRAFLSKTYGCARDLAPLTGERQ